MLTATTRARHASAAFLAELRERFGPRFSSVVAVRDQHARGEAPMAPQPPDAVVFARSNDDVLDLVRQCARERVPVIAHGAGSSLEGHLLAVQGGISAARSWGLDRAAVPVERRRQTVELGGQGHREVHHVSTVASG